jgi:hypothetical protein
MVLDHRRSAVGMMRMHHGSCRVDVLWCRHGQCVCLVCYCCVWFCRAATVRWRFRT